MQASRKALSKLTDFAKKFGIQPNVGPTLETEFGPFYPVQEALLSDLNTPEALGRCFRWFGKWARLGTGETLMARYRNWND